MFCLSFTKYLQSTIFQIACIKIVFEINPSQATFVTNF